MRSRRKRKENCEGMRREVLSRITTFLSWSNRRDWDRLEQSLQQGHVA